MKKMCRNRLKQALMLVGLLLVLAGCNFPTVEKEPQQGEMSLIMTAAAKTASVQLTDVSVNGLFQQLTAQAATALAPVTATPQATNSGLFTNSPTAAYATATALPCYKAQFDSDVTIPDGTDMAPGEAFTKTWRLKNIGTCTWQSNTQLVFVSGNGMNGLAATEINQTVQPGQFAQISIALNAPNSDGTYTGNYQLRSPEGVRFGLGTNADVSFWVKINVESVTYEMDPAHPLDFDENICAAKWSSTIGRVKCSSSSVDFTNGSVRQSSAPKLEGGYQDDEGTIIISPSAGSGGIMMGQYPKVSIKSADHFKAMIGCMNQRTDCNVLFELQYLDADDALHSLGSWAEKYDSLFTHIDVDLSSLDGKTVSLILKVENNGDSKDDEVFWLSPEIVR
jgi:hypothetical protein